MAAILLALVTATHLAAAPAMWYESSSSSTEHKKYLLDIAEPTATQDGKALRMEFDNQLANMSEKVDCHIQVVSEAGIYLDTVVDGISTGAVSTSGSLSSAGASEGSSLTSGSPKRRLAGAASGEQFLADAFSVRLLPKQGRRMSVRSGRTFCSQAE